MSTPFRITDLRFNGGESIDVGGADVVVLVGPNNSGKSRTLQELLQRLALAPGQQVPVNQSFVLDGVQIDRLMDAAQLRDWLQINRHCWVDGHGNSHVRTLGVGDLQLGQVESLWRSDTTLWSLATHLIRGLWCGERLGYLGSPGRMEHQQPPDHPIQLLVTRTDLRQQFGEAFREAFGRNVIVDAWGQNIRLRLSPDRTQADFRLSSATGMPEESAALDELRSLPMIESQSDGVRSFAGMLLTVLTNRYPIVLLDEPEAFLHPPQARLLGRYLSAFRQEGQVFVATHSLDVLLGLIEARPENVMVVRLTRENEQTSPRVLPPAQLAGIWADPFLRFSRTLDGLFHQAVVACEGDTDTQFYSMILELLKRRGDVPPSLDVMFTYCGSKERIPLVASALHAIGVPVRAIADFDLLSTRDTLERVVGALGGHFDDTLASLWATLSGQLRGSEVIPTIGAVRTAVLEALGDSDQDPASKSVTAKARAALNPTTGWAAAKRSGVAAVPAGDATIALKGLLEGLAAFGVHVVPTGEVESFVKMVPGKGPRWVIDVVEAGLHEEADEAHRFLGDVLKGLGIA